MQLLHSKINSKFCELQRRQPDFRSEFVSFVHFVIGRAKNGKPLKIHWRPQNVICRPCHVSYDFIGRYESLYQDADFVLNRIGHVSPKPDDAADSNVTLSSMRKTNEVSSPRKLKFPRFDRDIRQTNSKHLVDNMMTLLSPSDIRELYRLYELDFRLYGYESKTWEQRRCNKELISSSWSDASLWGGKSF